MEEGEGGSRGRGKGRRGMEGQRVDGAALKGHRKSGGTCCAISRWDNLLIHNNHKGYCSCNLTLIAIYS